MIVDDFVMLGRTEPVESKRHGFTVCSAGYSMERRELMRIYPLPWPNNLKAWSLLRVPLRRPKQDNRVESWRIDAGETADDALAAVDVRGIAPCSRQFDHLQTFAVPSIRYANQRKPFPMSLAIIDPVHLEWGYARRRDLDPAEQYTLWDRREPAGPLHESDLIPTIRFTDDDGEHRLQLKEWGSHEYLRKNRDKSHGLWDALHLTDKNYRHLLLVGNQNNRRTSWLVIRLISERISQQQEMCFG